MGALSRGSSFSTGFPKGARHTAAVPGSVEVPLHTVDPDWLLHSTRCPEPKSALPLLRTSSEKTHAHLVVDI